MKKILFSLSCLMISSFALADNCDNTRNNFDDIYCTNKVYASADAELNKSYQALRAKLNATQKATLKRSQLAWIRERDSECTHASTVDVQCRLSKTQERNHWLRERIRECNTIGCKSSALD
ncbi:lysozyme inhibitor LprI family protein [Acinetobacter stercoris]|uniref:Lysozyme inhibitor LprI-like N-terminal domain-containing protein n=1 Tax=Acinetobacter stercoris TaxID=2126983 RepID=A0A2U3MYE8_9GAMM|nr:MULTISPECIES: lysozyme inhibitor LprI family protein [Acinetobacter]SPL70421.1 hypothetical protein KPC_1599 [Acinetobacter stercoris]